MEAGSSESSMSFKGLGREGGRGMDGRYGAVKDMFVITARDERMVESECRPAPGQLHAVWDCFWRESE